MRIVLLTDDCLILLLPSTHRHEILIQSSVEGPHCGLIPIGMPSERTTTTGLKWNLSDTEMRFGGLISTSNIVIEERITVHLFGGNGEVILDLSSAVKELVENSLDTGATSIVIALKEYGEEWFQVIDNGCGIPPSNFKVLALKHHTSKLADFSDLQSLTTFGFRGEAPSSLCALGDLTVETRTKNEPVATHLTFDHSGLLTAERKTARQIGTIVTVKKLFCNLPVRSKEFRRNIHKEYGKLISLLNCMRSCYDDGVGGGSTVMYCSTSTGGRPSVAVIVKLLWIMVALAAYALIAKGVRLMCTNTTGQNVKSVVLKTQGNGSLKDNIINSVWYEYLFLLRTCEYVYIRQLQGWKSGCDNMVLRPLRLDLSPEEEIVASMHMDTISKFFSMKRLTDIANSQREEEKICCEVETLKNGFALEEDFHAPPGHHFKLKAIPFSKNITFAVAGVRELISSLADSQGECLMISCYKMDTPDSVCPPRVRAMLASRACRSSVMIGDLLGRNEMQKILEYLADLKSPWNCPHVRPTMRHLVDLTTVCKQSDEDDMTL
ncbi:DNA mismatch repair protein [Actinidia rufa]|uniref:DNA mismatch repair protein n=1 Tax=Actinidia rufa TaxID=165716 RepID=A0A7J0DPN5_9ERIC|nr:DNA mismatch repair protein [Actinidia rufa]